MAGFLPPIVATLTADAAEFKAKISESLEKLTEFSERRGEAILSASTAEFQAKIDAAKEELAGLDAESDRAVVLRADISEYEAKMAEVKASTDEAEHTSSSSLSRLGGVGKMALLGIAGGVAAVGAAGLEMASKYDEATASMAGKANITTAAAQRIGQAFLGTAGKSTFSAQQMMEAFGPVSGEFVTMYGHALNASQALKVMSAAQDLAEASGEPLTSTTKALADAMLVYHLNVGQAGEASNTLWNTSRLLGVGVNDLGTSLSRLEPRIVGSGMSLQQTGAFMLELGRSAGSGRQAMRLAGTAIQSLISPSTSAQKALDAMGVSLTDSHGKFIGMPAAITALHSALARIPGDSGAVAAGEQLVAAQTELATDKTHAQTPALKAAEKALTSHIGVLKLQAAQLSKSSAMQAVFGRNANIMAAIVAGGVPAFDAATRAVSAHAAVESAAQRNAATFEGRVKALEATGKDLATSFGELLIPAVTKLASVMLGIVNFFEQNRVAALTLAAVIGGAMVVATGLLVKKLAEMAVQAAADFADMVAAGASWLAETSAQVAAWVAENTASLAESAALWAMYAGERVVEAASTAAAWVAGTVTTVAAQVAGAATAAAAWVVANAAMIAGIGAVVLVVVAAVALIIKYHKDIERAVIAVWDAIKAAATAVWDFIKSHVEIVLEVILGIIAPWAALIIHFHTQILAAAVRVWDAVRDTVRTVVGDITGFFSRLPGEIMSFLEGLPGDFLRLGEDMVHALLGAFSHIGSDIGGLVKSAVSHIPGVGGLLSHIPGLATGGIVSKPTLAMVGEAGPEAVVPLAQLAKYHHSVAPLPDTLSGVSGGASAPSGGAPITINAPVTVTLQGTPETYVRQIQDAIAANNHEIVYSLRAARS